MIKQNHTYTVKGISHHDVAGKLGVWLPECIGLPITLRRESASENEIGVESVAVYLIDEHLGYVDDNQKREALSLISRSERMPRGIITNYSIGKGPAFKWSQATLTIDVAFWASENEDDEYHESRTYLRQN